MSIQPYTIAVPDKALSDLRQRLSLATYPDQLEGTNNWDFGTPVAEIQRLANYWKDGFDWRKVEANLNQLPNFRTSIPVDGFGEISIHFVHQPSKVEGAIPLLFSHGWPGSFLEVTKILPLLSDGGPDSPSFHVVAPSLPNFGFSDGVSKRGFGLKQYAEVFHKLMIKLGYKQYVTQGGDWGFSVTRAMGRLYSDHCKASHLNLVLAGPPKWTQNPLQAFIHTFFPYSKFEADGLKRSAWFDEEGYGYNLLQSTKPMTIGFALADSPVALLAWIHEKQHDWTDNYPWTDDEILTWVSIYWFSTAGPAASCRIYYEATRPKDPENDLSSRRLRGWAPHVKLGLAHFSKEIQVLPKTWGRTLGPVVYESEHEGGHFSAWEKPQAIVGDLRNMFGKGGPCYAIVDGASGYTK